MEKKLKLPVLKCSIYSNKNNKQLNASLLKKPLSDILKNKIPKKIKIKDYEFEF
jgi:hypothetical protein